MPRHVDVYLDGISLHDLVPKVTITQVTEDPAGMDIVTASPAGRSGEWYSGQYRRSMKVSVSGNILEVHDLAARAMAIETIAAWAAGGGLLQVSYKPDRQLRVVCTKLPAMGTARDYTKEFSLEFTAYAVPYWENTFYTVAGPVTAASGTVSLHNPGTAPAPIEAVIHPTAACASFTLGVGGKSIALTSVSGGSRSELVFTRSVRDDLVITMDGVGILGRRTAASADDLWLLPGVNTVTWTAAASCEVALKVRGRYL